MAGLQHSWRRQQLGWLCYWSRSEDKKHTLPHRRLVPEEGWQGGFVAVPHGWQGGERVVSGALLPAHALCWPQSLL